MYSSGHQPSRFKHYENLTSLVIHHALSIYDDPNCLRNERDHNLWFCQTAQRLTIFAHPRRKVSLPLDTNATTDILISTRGGERSLSPHLKDAHVQRLRALRQRLQALKQLRILPVDGSDEGSTDGDVGTADSSRTAQAENRHVLHVDKDLAEAPKNLVPGSRIPDVVGNSFADGKHILTPPLEFNSRDSVMVTDYDGVQHAPRTFEGKGLVTDSENESFDVRCSTPATGSKWGLTSGQSELWEGGHVGRTPLEDSRNRNVKSRQNDWGRSSDGPSRGREPVAAGEPGDSQVGGKRLAPSTVVSDGYSFETNGNLNLAKGSVPLRDDSVTTIPSLGGMVHGEHLVWDKGNGSGVPAKLPERIDEHNNLEQVGLLDMQQTAR